LSDMTSLNLTFDEVMKDKDFSLMSKQRLKIFRDRAFKQLELIL
ncbi:TPA: conjugal transfer protein TraL, partial [Campylobacter fetus subsp. venerealis]|nr:conjugal transfer protein TraL [Campylobacter fetus subsp. venerealis]